MGVPLSFGSWQNEKCHGIAVLKIRHFFTFYPYFQVSGLIFSILLFGILSSVRKSYICSIFFLCLLLTAEDSPVKHGLVLLLYSFHY